MTLRQNLIANIAQIVAKREYRLDKATWTEIVDLAESYIDSQSFELNHKTDAQLIATLAALQEQQDSQSTIVLQHKKLLSDNDYRTIIDAITTNAPDMYALITQHPELKTSEYLLTLQKPELILN